MTQDTFERALHRWPKWLKSIDHGREVLAGKQAHPSLGEMKNAAEDALSALGFPSCTLFKLYWLCCVFCDYGKERLFDFNKLILPNWFPLPFGFQMESGLMLAGKRIYPPEVWSKADLDWQIEIYPSRRYGASHDDAVKALSDRMVDWAILLPSDHPIHKFVDRGRPQKKMPHGATSL